MKDQKPHNKNLGSKETVRSATFVSDTIVSMKPLGKYLGMDTFSWHNPDLELLEKTISTFPFELLWIGNENEINGFFNTMRTAEMKVNSCVVYGGKINNNCSKKTTSISTLEEAIEYLDSLVFKPGILLFTSSDSDSDFSMKFFEKHVAKFQSKP